VLKLAKKAAKRKQLKRGVKEVVKAIRKNVKGWAPPLVQLTGATSETLGGSAARRP
jgi:hypothetical protein